MTQPGTSSNQGPGVSDAKQVVLLEQMSKRIDSIHSTLSGTGEVSEGLDTALSGYEVIRALQASLKDKERTKALLDANHKKMATMQDRLDELRMTSEQSLNENRSTLEKRYDSFQEDIKQRQALIVELQKEKKDLLAMNQQKSQELSDALFKLNLAETDLNRSSASNDKVSDMTMQLIEVKAELQSNKAGSASLAASAARATADQAQQHASSGIPPSGPPIGDGGVEGGPRQ